MTDTLTNFRNMKEANKEDWMKLGGEAMKYVAGLPDRVLEHLNHLAGDFGGFPIDRLQHSLQTATRAHRDGRDEEYVVCALLHDIGDALATNNHPDVAAAILKPFISEKNHWMVKNHAIFQGYYFFEHIGLDKNMRDQFKDHEYFDYTAEFVEKYDQTAFDKDYDTLPLEFFEPMLRRVFSQVKHSIYKEALNKMRSDIEKTTA